MKNFPEYKDKVPKVREPNNGIVLGQDGVYTADNSRSKEVLGIQYHKFEDTVVDTVKSLKELGV